MLVGQRIKELRVERGLNQRELAVEIKVSQPTVAAWENEENEPKATYIYRLSKFFKVSADFLLGLEDELGNKKP